MSKSSQLARQARLKGATRAKEESLRSAEDLSAGRLVQGCPLCFPTTKLFFENTHWRAWRELVPGSDTATQIIVASRQHWDLFQLIGSEPGAVEDWFEALRTVAVASGLPCASLDMSIVLSPPKVTDRQFRGQFFHTHAIVTPSNELRGVRSPGRSLADILGSEKQEPPPTGHGGRVPPAREFEDPEDPDDFGD